MSTTKEDIASDIITNLTPSEMAWVVVEVTDDFVDNQSNALQEEIATLLSIEGVDVGGICRKKKTVPPH